MRLLLKALFLGRHRAVPETKRPVLVTEKNSKHKTPDLLQ
jgi:hypothetical protein